MASVDLTLPTARYAIDIEPGLLDGLGERVARALSSEGALAASAGPGKAALLVDEQVEPLHGRETARSLHAGGFDTQVALVPSGEENKTLGTYRELLEVLLEARLERQSPVIALGGGLTGDLAGFVAATYQRGLPLVQCPTTLLAMVDASVGGKTGVNMPQGKNLVGAFHQPSLVAIDTDALNTLPGRELRSGLAECIKHGVIRDATLFDWIEKHVEAIFALDPPTLTELVEHNVRIKAAVVASDEKEVGERAHLNFGHTFGHAIEAATEYSAYHHGEAVALGMVAATRYAVDAGRCEASVHERLVRLLDRVGLPVVAPDLPASLTLVKAMGADKKVHAGRVRLVLPDEIGRVSIVEARGVQPLLDAFDSLRG